MQIKYSNNKKNEWRRPMCWSAPHGYTQYYRTSEAKSRNNKSIFVIILPISFSSLLFKLIALFFARYVCFRVDFRRSACFFPWSGNLAPCRKFIYISNTHFFLFLLFIVCSRHAHRRHVVNAAIEFLLRDTHLYCMLPIRVV